MTMHIGRDRDPLRWKASDKVQLNRLAGRMQGVGGQVVAVQGIHERYGELRLHMFGDHAARNAAAALVAMEAFLDRRISFPAIAELVEETLERIPVRQPATIDDILEMDRESRSVCRELAAQAVPSRA